MVGAAGGGAVQSLCAKGTAQEQMKPSSSTGTGPASRVGSGSTELGEKGGCWCSRCYLWERDSGTSTDTNRAVTTHHKYLGRFPMETG